MINLIKTLKINDIVMFNPNSFEGSRLTSSMKQWIFCDGYDMWRGNSVPFIKLAVWYDTKDADDKTLRNLDWIRIPCDSTSCMLIVEQKETYVKLRPLNDDYLPPVSMDNVWISTAVLEHGVSIGMLEIVS